MTQTYDKHKRVPIEQRKVRVDSSNNSKRVMLQTRERQTYYFASVALILRQVLGSTNQTGERQMRQPIRFEKAVGASKLRLLAFT